MRMNVGRALLLPAYNLSLSVFICGAAALLLLIAGLLAPSRNAFLVAATLIALPALALVYAGSRADLHGLYFPIARTLGRAGRGTGAGQPARPGALAVLLYCAGFIGCVGAYSYLSLASFSTVRAGDDSMFWGFVDKRPLIFGYALLAAFITFHCFMVRFLFAPTMLEHPSAAAGFRAGSSRPDTFARRAVGILGGCIVAFLAYWWICLAALSSVDPGDGSSFAGFYDHYSHLHHLLGASEQIRLGAIPFLEAETQYGLGNQVLMYFLTRITSYSSHGFYAANMLLNAVCVVGFFVIVQRFLGSAWAIVGLIGWLVWPSPYHVIDLGGWAIFTRWIALPILALLLAHSMLAAGPRLRTGLWPLVAGAIWGVGGFLSQESLSGGAIVFVLSIGLFGAAGGMPLRAIVGYCASFVASGAAVFLVLVASFVGVSRLPDYFRLANAKSSLVTAGVSNTWWSDNLALSVAFTFADARPHVSLQASGEWAPLLQTYGSAVLLMASIALLAGFLRRRSATMSGEDRRFIARFGGVAVGAYALHLFTLLRSDLSHLAGPSFLLPLFIAMLPLFVWRCVAAGLVRNSLLVVSIGAILVATIAARSELGRKLGEIDALARDSRIALAIYGELAKFNQPSSDDLAARYSPIPKFQAAFRDHPDFKDTQELFGLLHERLQGRRVELGLYKLNALIAHRELFYFFGRLRSVSGITSPTSSIWLTSEEDAWIDKVVGAQAACVFFEPQPAGKLFDAWTKSIRLLPGATTEPIVGRKDYGILSCKGPNA